MKLIAAKMAEIAETMRVERKQMAKQHEETKIGEITAGQVLGGIRGVPAMICDTSTVNPDEGLRIRNIPILELTKAQPEDIFFLLCTGAFPNDAERTELHDMFTRNSSVPYYVWNVLESMPRDSHPMVMLSTAILVMERESNFRRAYDSGKGKDKMWMYMLEDAFLLLSRITTIAAAIYRMRFDKGERIQPRTDLDWGANFAYMLGLPDTNSRFTELIRMYLVLHSDHEGGNVSAFTAHTVSSALSDLFYSFSAAMNGLAGPLHGLANQECLSFVLELHEKFGGVPSDEELTKELWSLLNSGQVIPGYGHAVLRVTDPRFTAFYNFGKQNCVDDKVFGIVDKLFQIAPKVLTEQGKAKNVWPNVDAASGSLLNYYGMTEFEFYTVMFGVSRAMGISAQLVLARASGAPITRPKGLTTPGIKKLLGMS
ncbi:MAG: citrate (Si)-synthase [Candidatus Kapaibacterium sp.]|nr:MAG: citrate (Si)-synthase [Candidatus Kapabacteria bacterium]